MKSDLMRRASLVVGTALLVLALVILAVGPRTTFRAETSFIVSRPLLATDVVAELRLVASRQSSTGSPGGAPASAGNPVDNSQPPTDNQPQPLWLEGRALELLAPGVGDDRRQKPKNQEEKQRNAGTHEVNSV